MATKYLLGEIIDDKIAFGSYILPQAKIVLTGFFGVYILICLTVPSFGWPVFIVYLILLVVAAYRLYKLYRPASATVYMFFSYILVIALLICVYVIRNDEPHEYLPGFSDAASH